MTKQNRKILLAIILVGFIIFILYLFNTEKFYPEFWLHKKIEKYSCIEPIENIDLSKKSLMYKFYDDSGIDIEVLLNSNGYVSISLFKWFKDNPKTKTHIFKTDEKVRTVVRSLPSFFFYS